MLNLLSESYLKAKTFLPANVNLKVAEIETKVIDFTQKAQEAKQEKMMIQFLQSSIDEAISSIPILDSLRTKTNTLIVSAYDYTSSFAVESLKVINSVSSAVAIQSLKMLSSFTSSSTSPINAPKIVEMKEEKQDEKKDE